MGAPSRQDSFKMAIRTVGPTSTFPTIKAAMAASGPNDEIVLEAGYSNEAAWVAHNGMTITGDATSTGIQLFMGAGVASVFLAGAAPINIRDALDGDAIVGNDGNNVITVRGGADSVNGGLGNDDRLVVDYRLATGAVTGDSTSNVSEAGGGGRLVTIVDGTIEHFTIMTGSGADTITTGAGDDIIRTGEGAGTVTAGQGANTIVGGSGADTITALDGGNRVDAGDGANHVTTGGGADFITTGIGADTIVAGGGNDSITVTGGADTSNAGAGFDTLTLSYSTLVTNVTGGVTGGDALAGYTGHLGDGAVNLVDFVATENFSIVTGSGNDDITTGDHDDYISTGAGRDVLRGGGGNDLLLGGADVDKINAGSGNDEVWGDDGNDWINAGSGNDKVWGGYGADRLGGAEGTDWIDGGGGHDQLNGGAGRDFLQGGTGHDVFIFSEASETAVGSNRDQIGDFISGEDFIDLSLMATNAGVSFTFVETGGFSNTAGEVLQFMSGANTIISGDVDGNGAQDFQILLVGAHDLSSADFWMV
jgi:Ca2+-binding RTX toxin-like protein